MKNPSIVISGQAGHGKDTIGSHLVQRYGYSRVAFGDPLKWEVFAAYREAPKPVSIAFLDVPATKNTLDERLALLHCSDQVFVRIALDAFQNEDVDMSLGARLRAPRSPRRIMQAWGTEYRRAQRATYWIDKMQSKLDAADRPMVICDGRFADELEWARKNGVHRIHVVRKGLTSPSVRHVSEQIPPLTPSDSVVFNDQVGGLDRLFEQVDAVMHTLHTNLQSESWFDILPVLKDWDSLCRGSMPRTGN